MKSWLMGMGLVAWGTLSGQFKTVDYNSENRSSQSTLLQYCKFDNNAYFEEGDSTLILNFEAKILKDAMHEYPTMIVSFSLYQLPGESIQLGKSRINTFQKLLKKEKLDLTRIQISQEVHYYRIDQSQEKRLKPGIFGVIEEF
jgi:hypothetical protein